MLAGYFTFYNQNTFYYYGNPPLPQKATRELFKRKMYMCWLSVNQNLSR